MLSGRHNYIQKSIELNAGMIDSQNQELHEQLALGRQRGNLDLRI